MLRTKRLVIPLRTDERKVIDRLARRERLPTSTLARKVLLDLAEQRGLFRKTDSDR